MSYYNRKYFDEMKVGELVKIGFRPISVSRLRGMNIKFQSVYEDFAKNLNATTALGAYTGIIGSSANYLGYRLAYAVHKETGSFDLGKRFSKVTQTDINLSRKEVNAPEVKASRRKLERVHDAMLRELIDSGKRGVTDGMDAVMRAMVVFAWTTFESLCEDLLERAIDMRPNTFAVFRGRPGRRAMPIWEGTNLKGKTNAFSDVKGPKTRNQLTYRSVKAIRDSYWLAFHTHYQQINKIIIHRSIDTLFAVRNVLVHRGGKVDRHFLSRVSGLPLFASAREGTPLCIDFAMVKSIIKPVFGRAIGLIVAVNRWVMQHPDR
jgi:hypothetical protein